MGRQEANESYVMKKNLIAVFVAFWSFQSQVNAQGIMVVPDQLSTIPIGGLAPQRYWQQLSVTLPTSHRSSDKSITIFLPDGLNLVDSDNDGQFRDEVRVSYDLVGFNDPSIFVSDQTNSLSIVLGSLDTIAEASTVYIQFPVYAATNTPTGVVVYYSVLFDNESETNFTQSPEVRFVDESQWSLLGFESIVNFSDVYAAGADTLILFDGYLFPQEPKPLVKFLSDFVSDRDVTSSSNVLEEGDENDDNDMVYSFFWSESADLTHIDTLNSKSVLTSSGNGYRSSEKSNDSIQLDLSQLSEGSYFIYAISNLTEDLVLGRSRKLQILRPPEINYVDPDDDVTLDSGGLYNLGGIPDGKGPRGFTIDFEVNDGDDADDPSAVYLFVSRDSTLTIAANTFDSDGLPELANAELLNKAGPLDVADNFFWEFSGPDFFAEGEYYVYAIVSDGNSIILKRSTGRIQIIHSPYLRFDTLTDDRGGKIDTVFTGGINPQRFLTFTWGRQGFNGDSDLDDNALIDLYYSNQPAGAESGLHLPSSDGLFSALLNDKAWVITGGVEEDGDLREDNQFVWDLWSLENEENPALIAGTPYYFYGLISDRKHRRLVQMNGGQENDRESNIVFSHPPSLTPLQPAENIILGPGDFGRIAWDAIDIDDDARVRVLLVSSDFGRVAKYRELVESEVYVVNSSDGYNSSGIDTNYDLSENDSGDYVDFSIDHLERGINTSIPPETREYNVYLSITDQNEFTEAWCWRAPGPITVASQGLDNISSLLISLWPEQFIMGNQGTLQTFELRVTADQPLDLIKASILFDNVAFSPIDQNSDLDGVQPFYLSPDFSSAKMLKNTVSLLEDGSGQSVLTLEYLDPSTGNISGLRESNVLAYFKMQTLLYSGPTSLELKVGDLDQPLSLLGLDGEEIESLNDGVLSNGVLISGRAALNGSIQLEGRVSMEAEATIQLRSKGSFLSISDSIFAVSNDSNPNRSGIQTYIDPNGEFELNNVPTGLWDLHLKVDGYLPGISRNLSVSAGQVLGELQPMSDPYNGNGFVLGGDVAGYVDENGELLPDNEITLADWDYVASYFGLNVNENDKILKADITGDGKIDIVDLSIIGANFSKRGLDPVYKNNVVARSTIFQYELEKKPINANDVYVIPITKIGSELLIGYQFQLEWSEADWDWVSITSFDSDVEMSAVRKTTYGMLWGSVAMGGRPIPTALEWKLKARVDNPELPIVKNALAVDNKKNTINASVEIRSADLAPSIFKLNTNYPNPFNPSTLIPFGISFEGPISLIVYDILGRPVKEIYNGWISSGWYEMSWDGLDAVDRKVASGVYFCRLKSEKEVQTISMVLLR